MAHNLQAESALVSTNLKTTSLIVAECFGKRHDNVVRAIETLEVPDDYHLLNFEEMFREQKVNNGAVRKFPYYELTRDGFALLVMGFTGRKALAWKIRFLEAFNAMEAALLEPAPDTLPFSMDELTDEARALLQMADEAYAAAGRMKHQASRLFSKAQHNRAFAPKPIPAPDKETLVRAHVRKLPKREGV